MKLIKEIGLVLFMLFATSVSIESHAGIFGPDVGADDYTAAQARQAFIEEDGTVMSAKPVKIHGQGGLTGTALGGLAGGALGNLVGGGRGKILMTIVGGIAGAVGGNTIQEKASGADGVQLTVKLESGKKIVVVQEDSGEKFAAGDKVQCLTNGQQVRITH